MAVFGNESHILLTQIFTDFVPSALSSVFLNRVSFSNTEMNSVGRKETSSGKSQSILKPAAKFNSTFIRSDAPAPGKVHVQLSNYLFKETCRFRGSWNIPPFQTDQKLIRLSKYYSREEYDYGSVAISNFKIGGIVFNMNIEGLQGIDVARKVLKQLFRKAKKGILCRRNTKAGIVVFGNSERVSIAVTLMNAKDM